MKDELKNIIKEKIIYHADETKYRYEIGKAVMNSLADDIVNALQTYNLLQKRENNPLTLDKVRELKSGDIVWLKDEDGLRAIEYSHIHNSKYRETVYYFMFDVEGIEGYDLVYLNESFFIYRNKPDHIADVSKKEEQK